MSRGISLSTAGFNHLPSAALIGQSVQEEAPALDTHHRPQSGWETWIRGAPPSTVAADRCVYERYPERCACGHTVFAMTTPYQTHQVMELPPVHLGNVNLEESRHVR